MSKAKILIVEDDALIADSISDILEELGYEVTAISDTYETALNSIKKQKPDLILLDINLKGNLDGIDLAHQLNKQSIHFIFLTSQVDAKTIDKAKLVYPLGYITKPFTKADLQTNIEIALFKINTDHQPDDLQKADSINEFYFVKEKNNYIKLKFDTILYAEACDSYTIIYTSIGKYMVSQTLKVIEEKFSKHNFYRVHRTYLVNLKQIEKILPKAVLIDNKEIPISENNRAVLLKLLGAS
ncbi:MAG: response regulator [Bacteroidota bacterium]|nr:response regulator [Bacteroidota bacterium]